MYVCYLQIKKPRGRKWEHVLTFTDNSVTAALNRVATIDLDTVMTKKKNNNFVNGDTKERIENIQSLNVF